MSLTWTIYIENKLTDRYPLDFKEIKKLINSCLEELDLTSYPASLSELSVLFTDDQEIQNLNKNYRDKDKATDVLSFSQLEGTVQPEPTSLGDIVISLETAERQAPEFDNDFNAELNRLIVHGLLHLLGYNHEAVSTAEAQAMFELQDSLLEKLKTTIC